MRAVEVPEWLKRLPLAPEYRPTDTEFEDPIAYISKIEKEASHFGICKIVPPLPKPSRKYVISNLNKSLVKRPELGPAARPQDACSTSSAVFTTRQQELGQNGKSAKKVVRKQVWQSGEVYTLEQFEAKAKAFARGHLRDVKAVSPLAIETLFWEAACDKPIYVEYANDVPGSGFGEPVGSYRRLNRRRRKITTFRRNCGGSCADTSTHKTPETVLKPNVSSNQESRRSDSGDDMDCGAGWKLSNSPWNLQVIARSLGSLTRFMADDIPGVTSPMVYIGMLFSWFAWHVEDHELHSMNYLHTGLPKTWYAVPGDYAFSFEEVVRRQAYGADVDRLASLTKLGEKTTLLSPEAIVDSSIPCCRLVQNPGEFVVTFPRAYHVGFSHGFNCGEAANFGTLKWLEVAKEAAVRRAAMNYLPMLSHQQLLYLLTMSFVSRIPRELLPGSRSSRLRDRQKDERELSVKKAFLDDILSENKLLTTVLRRSCSNRVVVWDLESLPSFAKLPELCIPSNTIIAPEDNVFPENKNNQDLLRDMNLYMENVNDLYMDNDDLSGDFQLYSGSLACVACGVLGFPFMSVVQPSVRASVDLMQEVGVSKHDRSHSSPVANDMVDVVSVGVRDDIELCGSNSLYYSNGESSSGMSIKSMTDSSVNLSTSHDLNPLEVPKVTLEPQVEKGWCSTKGFLRPRIFCLEHAVHVRDLLQSKGGANVLVICHSDFKKMEAHAAVIKEQIGGPFSYKEVPLDNATQGDLNLIDLAIDDDEHVECGKDWTSKLSINLRHCVETRKSSMCKLDQHVLPLGGLFSETDSRSNTFGFKWPFRKSRSERSLKKSPEHIKMEKSGLGNLIESRGREDGQFLVVKSSSENIRNEREVIQYSRRKFKCKPRDFMVKMTLTKQVHDEASVADSGDQYSKNLVNTVNTGKKSSGLGISASNGNCGLQFGTVVSVSSQAACSVTPGAKISDDSTGDFEMQHETEVDRSTENIVTFSAENSACSVVIATEGPQHLIKHGESKSCVADSGSVDLAPSCCSDSVTAISAAHREEREVEKLSENVERGDCVEEEDTKGMNEDKKELVPGDDKFDQSSVISKDAGLEVLITSAVEEINSDGYHPSPDNAELESDGLAMVGQKSSAKNRRKRRRELDLQVDNPYDFDGFIRSPCESLRPRSSKHAKLGEIVSKKEVKEKSASDLLRNLVSSYLARKDKKGNEKESHRLNKENQVVKEKTPSKKLTNSSNSSFSHKDKKEYEKGSRQRDIVVKEKSKLKKSTNPSNSSFSRKNKKEKEKRSFKCDIENCPMRFNTKEALNLHKSYQCPHKGCGKSFSSHTNTVRHQRVHDKDRPLKCQWKGCQKSFKWEWSRIEHMRLHTGERPYSCKIEGCGLTFRFISDFSRHRRKTGHYVNPST